MAEHNRQAALPAQPARRRRDSHDVRIGAFRRLEESTLVQLMKACATYDSLYRARQEPVAKQPDTCVSDRSGVC